MADDVKQYDFKVVETSTEYDNFLYKATIQPEYQRGDLELEQSGRYHVLLLWPLGTVHFLVYKKEEDGSWDIDDVEEEEDMNTTGDTSENVNPLSLESIIPDNVLEAIGEKIEATYTAEL